MHQQQQSPLFRLPSELRNNIYELVFESWSGAISINEMFSTGPPESLPVPSSTSGSLEPPSAALLRSCKRARKEGNDAFDAEFQRYWNNEFVIDIREYPRNEMYVRFVTIMPMIPNDFLARIRNFTLLVRHLASRIRVTCLWSELEGRWIVNAEHDELLIDDDDDEVAHAAKEDVQDSMMRSAAFTTTSPRASMSAVAQVARSTLDRRILHDALRPFIVEEMFYVASQERGSHRPWRD